jgi:predicted RNase H-like HicB family nuclease
LLLILGDILRLSAVISKEGCEYVALCPEIDVASQGDSVEAALANLKEAVELYLEDEKDIKLSDSSPFVTTFEVKAWA